MAMDRLAAKHMIRAALGHIEHARFWLRDIGPIAGMPDGVPEAYFALDFLGKAEHVLSQAMSRIPDNGPADEPRSEPQEH